MIVQSAEPGGPHLVITMAEHTALAGELAEAFGNDEFATVEPREQMLFVIGNHDCGWSELDGSIGLDAKTGLPYNLTETPFEQIIGTSSRSPTINEGHHAYCGLISSMHSWGLYNGRYGLSDHVLLDGIAAEHRPEVDAMLDGELARQQRLKADLAADPATAPWIADARLFRSYKQLQFFDTMALYFNRAHEAARTEAEFPNVPRNESEDVAIAIRPLGEGAYGLSPYPFAEDGLELSFSGRYFAPVTGDGEGEPGATLAAAPSSRQSVRLVAN